MTGGLRIGTLIGIPVYVHYSWLAIFALVTLNLTLLYGEEPYLPEAGAELRVFLAVVTSFLFFASVIAHELAHSVIAIRNQVPVLSITLFIFGGIARIGKEVPTAKVEASIAIAGPIMSLALGVLFWLISGTIGAAVDEVRVITLWLSFINFALGIFNLLPGFPMDGGRVLRAAIWSNTGDFTRSTAMASSVGRFMGFGFMVLGAIQIFTTGNIGGLWLVLIGWFIENAASSSYTSVLFQQALEELTADQVMGPLPPLVPVQATVDALVSGALLPEGLRFAFVTDQGKIVGIVSASDVARVPREAWPTTPLAQVARGWAAVLVVDAKAPALEVLTMLGEAGVNQVPVTQAGEPVGLVTRGQLLEFIRNRSQLKSAR